MSLTESIFEDAALEWLSEQGYALGHASVSFHSFNLFCHAYSLGRGKEL
jgi:hypothetical protein